MHCYKYDATSETGFGNMYELLKQVKAEAEPLPVEDGEEDGEGKGGNENGDGESGGSANDVDGKKEDLPTPLQIELGGWNH